MATDFRARTVNRKAQRGMAHRHVRTDVVSTSNHEESLPSPKSPLLRSPLTKPPGYDPSEAFWTQGMIIVSVMGIVATVLNSYDSPGPGTIILTAFSFIALIIPLHDCTHGELTGMKWLDYCVGSAVSMLFISLPFPMYHSVHHRSHKIYESAGLYPWTDYKLRRSVVAPALWATEDLHLCLALLRDIRHHGFLVLLSSVVLALVPTIAMCALAWHGFGAYVMFWWLLPSRLGIMGFAAWFGDNFLVRKRSPENEESMTPTESEAFKKKIIGTLHAAHNGHDHDHRQPRVALDMPPRSEIVPTIAYPTILLTVFGFAVWFGTIYMTYENPPYWAMLVVAAAIYVLFTPFHDASHSSVSFGKYRIINEVIGRLCAFGFYFSPFAGFRYIHLMHHKHINQYDDPDLWAGAGNRFFLPIKWLTQDLDYLWFWTKRMENHRRGHICDNLSHILIMWTIVTTLGCHGYWYEIFHYYLIPSRLASGWLVFSFDYIPHRPHNHTKETNIYKTTSMIDGLIWSHDIDLSYLMLYQNLHNIHHLYSFVPFYNYPKIWNRNKDKLIDLGTPVVTYAYGDSGAKKPPAPKKTLGGSSSIPESHK